VEGCGQLAQQQEWRRAAGHRSDWRKKGGEPVAKKRAFLGRGRRKRLQMLLEALYTGTNMLIV
jgi:hypothetical protein